MSNPSPPPPLSAAADEGPDLPLPENGRVPLPRPYMELRFSSAAPEIDPASALSSVQYVPEPSSNHAGFLIVEAGETESLYDIKRYTWMPMEEFVQRMTMSLIPTPHATTRDEAEMAEIAGRLDEIRDARIGGLRPGDVDATVAAELRSEDIGFGSSFPEGKINFSIMGAPEDIVATLKGLIGKE